MSERSPGADVPIPRDVIEGVAERRAVEASRLVEAIESIHADLLEGADAIHKHYRSEDSPPPLLTADGLAEVIFVVPSQWEQLPTDLDEETREAAKAVHAEFARTLGASGDRLAGRDALVMPSMELGRVVRAGLSRRQAEVQILRNDGLTQAEIGDRLGMATNTVKIHCHRVDSKVDDAKRLLEHVEG